MGKKGVDSDGTHASSYQLQDRMLTGMRQKYRGKSLFFFFFNVFKI